MNIPRHFCSKISRLYLDFLPIREEEVLSCFLTDFHGITIFHNYNHSFIVHAQMIVSIHRVNFYFCNVRKKIEGIIWYTYYDILSNFDLYRFYRLTTLNINYFAIIFFYIGFYMRYKCRRWWKISGNIVHGVRKRSCNLLSMRCHRLRAIRG